MVTDPTFTRALAQDPANALAGYSLSDEDLSLLSTQVSFDRGAVSTVEERTSKAGLFGLLSTFAEGLGGLTGGGVGDPGQPVGLGGPDTAPGDEEGIIILDSPADPGSADAMTMNATPGGIEGIIDDDKVPGDAEGIRDEEGQPHPGVADLGDQVGNVLQ